MKRILLTLLLGLALSLASAQVTPLPDSSRFDQPVEFQTTNGGESLRMMISALARSVDLTALVDDVPDKTITYDIGSPKPFRQVWNLVLTLNNLDYVLLENDIIVVGTPASLAGLRPAEEVAPTIVRIYPVTKVPSELKDVLDSQFAERDMVSVSAFDETGLLSVRATEAQQEVVAEVLRRFDPQAALSVRRAYPLSYAKAEELKEVLEQTIITDEEETPTVEDGSSDAEDNQSTGTQTNSVVRSSDITIAADARSNRIVVTAPEVIQSEIQSLISELDQPQQQVNIQVRIQEITTNAAQELGFNLNASIGAFSTTLLETGLDFVFDAQKAITGLNLDAALNTLERQGLARRVDDSNLTVRNNGTGNLQSGGTIYITLPGTDGTNVEREIPYGVQIEVSPQISNNGDVTLDVDAKVETLVSETNDPSFLNISTRNVNSQVTLAPGQTIVLGGLMQNELRDAVSRVPLLGSLPIVGSLFSSTTTEESNGELLLIVTADVLE